MRMRNIFKYIFTILMANCLVSCSPAGRSIDRHTWDRIREAEPLESKNETPDMAKILARKKVVYYDTEYPTSWVHYPELLVKFLEEKGFFRANADELKLWMEGKIKKNISSGTVCVLSMGVVPAGLVEPRDRDSVLYRYMEAGGRVVWIGDYPLWHLGLKGGFTRTFRDETAWSILGIYGHRLIDVDRLPRHSEISLSDPARGSRITSEGTKWGMKVLDNAHTFIGSENATEILSDVHPSWACSWFKNYNPRYPASGFVQYRSTVFDGRDNSQNEDVYRIATHMPKAVQE